MADKDYDNEGEYQYRDDLDQGEPVEAAEPVAELPAPAKKSLLKRLKNRKVLFVLGFVIVVVIVYNVLGSGRSASPNAMPVLPPAAIQAHAPVVPLAVLPIEEPKPAPKPIPEKRVVQSTIDRTELNVIANNIATAVKNSAAQQLQSFSADYNARLDGLQEENATLNKKLDDMNHHLAVLSTQLTTLQTQNSILRSNQARMASDEGYHFNASGAITTAAVSSTQAASATANTKPIYTVQAVIPGRAWLSTNDGSTLTVAVGDVVPGFGEVVSIDSMKGLVVTRSGQVISSGE